MPAQGRTGAAAAAPLDANANLLPSAFGFVKGVQDAARLIQYAAMGKIPTFSTCINDARIQHGSIFVYSEETAVFARWIDGRNWSQSQATQNNTVFLYREYVDGYTAGQKKLSRRDPLGVTRRDRVLDKATRSQRGPYPPVCLVPGLDVSQENPPDLVGTLFSNEAMGWPYKFDGLVKRTIKLTYREKRWHVVSYYVPSKVRRDILWVQDSLPELRTLDLDAASFNVNNKPLKAEAPGPALPHAPVPAPVSAPVPVPMPVPAPAPAPAPIFTPAAIAGVQQDGWPPGTLERLGRFFAVPGHQYGPANGLDMGPDVNLWLQLHNAVPDLPAEPMFNGPALPSADQQFGNQHYGAQSVPENTCLVDPAMTMGELQRLMTGHQLAPGPAPVLRLAEAPEQVYRADPFMGHTPGANTPASEEFNFDEFLNLP